MSGLRSLGYCVIAGIHAGRRRVLLLVAGAMLLGASGLRAEESDPALTVARGVDQLLEQAWAAGEIVPAPEADDAEFLRRVSLDLCGRIPPASEVRDFVSDTAADKRARKVAELLESPTFIIHYTNVWRAAMVPEADADQGVRFQLPGFEAWLRSRIAENRDFSKIAVEMLTLPPPAEQMAAVPGQSMASPLVFYSAKEQDPARLTSAAARLFLGLRLDCAQCHDHPFDDWKQDQFWELAAFFHEFAERTAGDRDEPASVQIAIPDTERVVSARFLDGTVPEWNDEQQPRAVLADWVTSPENPYFARATVNRLWAAMFGVGLVDPADDFGRNNPPSHPEILDLLATSFVSHGYDIKFVLRAIANTRAYQLSSRLTDPSQEVPRTFARMPIRGMTPEQIFDSIAQAIGYRQPFDPEQPLNFNNDVIRQEFIETFAAEAGSVTDRETSILQALALMNGQLTTGATDLADSRTLAAVVDAPFLSSAERIDSLYLSTLSRYPSERERKHCLDYVSKPGGDGDSADRFADLFWALLNSNEFLLNH